MKLSRILLVAAAFQLVVTTAFGETFRCPNGALVSEGDRLAQVRTKCDPPTYVDKLTEGGGYGTGGPVVEEWTYDGGPSTFVYYLTFTNGVLTKIVSGDYGTRKQ